MRKNLYLPVFILGRRFLFQFVLLCIFSSVVVAQRQEELRVADMGRCVLENGQAIEPCKIGFRTFGSLNAERKNAVLVPMWFTGKTEQLQPKVGPGKLFDSTKYYIIAVDPFGNGVSSSPSNSENQPGNRFPRFTIRDMVRAQHRLLNEVLGLAHLHAIVGISMGGMQAFEWAVSYPDFADKVVSIVGSPQVTSYDLLLWEAVIRAIEVSQKCADCDPVGVYAPLIYLVLQTPEYRVKETSREEFPRFLKSITDEERQDFRPEDLKSQMRAKMAHDVASTFGDSLEQAAKRVKAEVLIIVSANDHIQRPESAAEFARLIAARIVKLNSDCGHLANDCEAELIAKEVNIFLAR